MSRPALRAAKTVFSGGQRPSPRVVMWHAELRSLSGRAGGKGAAIGPRWNRRMAGRAQWTPGGRKVGGVSTESGPGPEPNLRVRQGRNRNDFIKSTHCH